MTSEEILSKTFKILSAISQQELLAFAEFLKSKEKKQEAAGEFHVRIKRLGFRKDLNYDKIGELLEEIAGAARWWRPMQTSFYTLTTKTRRNMRKLNNGLKNSLLSRLILNLSGFRERNQQRQNCNKHYCSSHQAQILPTMTACQPFCGRQI